VLECDASSEGIGVALMQNRHSIAYESRKLRDAERLYSTYDKEMIAIMHVLPKFRQYLVGGKFVVRNDHNNLKYFLEQKDLNERQQKWESKIQANDFDIEYVKGKKNVVVNALFRRPTLCSMTEISAHLLVEYSKNTFACEFMDGKIQDNKYKVIDDAIYYKDRISLVPESKMKDEILRVVHDTPLAGHPGFFKTYRQVRKRFSWKGLKDDVSRTSQSILSQHVYFSHCLFQNKSGRVSLWISLQVFRRSKAKIAYLWLLTD